MCTVFKLQSQDDAVLLVGKNYDTPAPCYGMIFTNPRRIEKTALLLPPEIPKEWKASYGSVTFSQAGKEFPACGMNEAGLVVEQTTLWNTTYPDRDRRPALKELQWIQYMLDTCASAEEVIAGLQDVRIAQEGTKLQFFVCDAGGDTALVEYILGREIVLREADIPYPVIANDMYETSLDYLHIHQGYGGQRELVKSSLSIDRFAITAAAVLRQKTAVTTDTAVDTGFAILRQAEFELTQWQILYQPRQKKIWYSSQGSPERKSIDLTDLAFSGKSLGQMKNIGAGQGEEFTEYTAEANYELAKAFFTTSAIAKAMRVTEAQLLAFSRYPETHTSATASE